MILGSAAGGRRWLPEDSSEPMDFHQTNTDSSSPATLARPGTWILIASVLTLGLFGLLTYHVNVTLRVGSEMTQAYLRGEALRDLIVEHERELLSAAAMQVATGEQRWLERHRALEEKLFASLNTAIEDPQPGYDTDALNDIRQSASDLSRVHADAFQLAAAGQSAAALALLSDSDYGVGMDRFGKESTRFIEAFRAYLQAELVGHRRHELRSLGVGMAIVGICILMWVYLARRVRKRNEAFQQELVARSRLEAELLQSQKMEAVGRLASGIAHDFSNLITAIRGFATLARERLSPEHPARRSLARVEEAADQAQGVTRGLLTFSRKSASEKKPVDLVAQVQEDARWFRRVLPGTVRLNLDPGSQPEVWVLGDRGQIQQVLLNLVVNARDAMPDGGEVTIKIDTDPKTEHESEPRVTLSVTDTGAGMDPSVLQRAVEPFFTTKGSEAGTGLGLSVVHGIINDHGGSLRIDSLPGEGTEVKLSLPVVPAPVARDEGSSEEGNEVSGSGTVFLAQGHPYVRDILVTALEDAGFRVSPATSCPAFRSLYSDGDLRPDLIVLDNDLPDGCGVNCLEKIRAHGYAGPAIILAHELSPEVEGGLDADVMLLHKPVRVGDLRRLAVAMTRSRSSSEEAA
ncbi:MAG: response regulator [Gammaproteobacteria bacterium]|nr:MAG: response regulator [Gammaproteobacteria bacterium]